MGTAFGSGKKTDVGDGARVGVSERLGDIVGEGLVAVELGREVRLDKEAIEDGVIGIWVG